MRAVGARRKGGRGRHRHDGHLDADPGELGLDGLRRGFVLRLPANTTMVNSKPSDGHPWPAALHLGRIVGDRRDV